MIFKSCLKKIEVLKHFTTFNFNFFLKQFLRIILYLFMNFYILYRNYILFLKAKIGSMHPNEK